MRAIRFFDRMTVGSRRDELCDGASARFDRRLSEDGGHLIHFGQLCDEPILKLFELGFDLVEFLERALIERFAVLKPLLETHRGSL